MKVLFDGDVHVHYGFIHVEPPPEAEFDLISARGGQVNGLCGAAYPGVLAMVTGLHTGTVPLRFELHDEEPPLEDDWEDVVEAPLTVTADAYWVTAFDRGMEVEAPPAGTYRARWCASGMDEAHDGTRSADEPEIDRYLLQLWPAPVLPDAVIRQGSDIAAYWHQVAATTAPPPPPPTAEELAAQEAEEERRDRAAQAEWEAAQESAQWGGRAPTDELQAVGGRARQLAGLDRELVDALVALPAERQRALAVWAARQACEVAGIADVDVVQAGLSAAARGGPLPAPWQDWRSVWDRLFPSAGGRHSTATRIRPADEVFYQPLAPQATAIDAVREAGESDPARAVVGAVDAWARGHGRPREVLDDIRRRVAAGDLPG